MLSRHLFKLPRASSVASLRSISQFTLWQDGSESELGGGLRSCYRDSTRTHWRQLSTSKTQLDNSRQRISTGNIFNSNLPDIAIPDDIPFHDYFFNIFDKHADSVALEEFTTGATCTYGQLKASALRVASGLHRQGIRKGDIALVFSANRIDIVILQLACSKLGVWFSAANPAFTPDELRDQMKHMGNAAVFVEQALSGTMNKALSLEPAMNTSRKFVFDGEAEGFQPFQTLVDDDGAALPNVDISPLQDVLTLPYSSGTSGFPKGVMLTHHSCLANVLQATTSLWGRENDVFLGLLPMYHIYGMMILLFGSLKSGGKIVLLPKFEPGTFLECIQRKRVTFTHLVPPLILFLAKHPACAKFDLSSIEKVVSAAAPLGASLSAEFLARYPSARLYQGYGLTEMSPVVSLDCTDTLGCAGHLVANSQGKVVDLETKQALGPHNPGELWLRGPHVMKGYFQDAEATMAMVTEDGWLATGDEAYFDHDGKLYIVDRIKELIKYKGSQVSPAELESIVLTHPDVQDVAVIGRPDEAAGELPMAFVVKRPGSDVTEDDVVRFVEEKGSRVKRLRGGVQFIEAVPKNASGKILRRVLKGEISVS